MNKYIAFILMTGCFFSCTHTGKDKIVSSIVEEGVISSSVPQKLTVRLTEDIYDRLETVLQPVSYVKLSNTPLLGHIKKVCIIDEHIFVWDVASGIVCYDMSGKFLFLLNARGQGPGEYTDISAFTINTHLKELVIYDNAKQTLMFYSAKNGKFLRSEQFNKPAPTEMAYFGGYFLYNNRLHRNYQDDVSLHYSLLASKDGIHIDHRYFKHQEREEQYPFSVSMRNLHDNYSKLYYCRDFDNIVYQVDEDSVIPRFQVELPQPVPNSKIEERPDEMKLLRSGYSLGITDIYQQGGLLSFRFIKDGAILSCLYDIKEKKQICCAKRIKFFDSSFVDTIDGVYKDCFYSILTPEYIGYALSENPEEFPDFFKEYDEQDDNPVIGFYKLSTNM